MSRRLHKLLILIVFFTLSFGAPSGRADKIDITGDWLCEYSTRSADKAMKTAAGWFQVTFTAPADFKGGGKTVAGGSTLNMVLEGKYTVADDGALKLTGVSKVARQRLPFRFVSDVKSSTLIERQADTGGVTYHTKCSR